MAHHQSDHLMENMKIGQVVTVPVVMEIMQDPSGIRPEMIGFSDSDSRELYEALRRISGIGRKSALAALESGSWQDTLRAVAARDERWLCDLPGIGKAKAATIVKHLTSKYGSALPAPLPVPLRDWIAAREDLMSSQQIDLDTAERLLLDQLR
jgi:Holliday junction resolvasome RuvABC DNA-binding subunit